MSAQLRLMSPLMSFSYFATPFFTVHIVSPPAWPPFTETQASKHSTIIPHNTHLPMSPPPFCPRFLIIHPHFAVSPNRFPFRVQLYHHAFSPQALASSMVSRCLYGACPPSESPSVSAPAHCESCPSPALHGPIPKSLPSCERHPVVPSIRQVSFSPYPDCCSDCAMFVPVVDPSTPVPLLVREMPPPECFADIPVADRTTAAA